MGRVSRMVLGIAGVLACLLVALGTSKLYITREAALARNRALELEIQDLSGEINSLRAERNRLADQVSTLTAEMNSRPIPPITLMSDSALRRLKDQGLSDPIGQIVAELRKRPDLIPFEASSGGTMTFRDDEKWVVTEKWVLAYCEDGHTGGRVLLEFSVNNGRLDWRRIAAYLIR